MTRPHAPPAITVVHTVRDLRAAVAAYRLAGQQVALVPTMGALHAGHLGLVETARRHADRVVATIFVNPRQFGPKEDLARYPRREAEDLAKLAAIGTDAVFVPSVEEMYPAGFVTRVEVTGPPAEGLEAASRPHFFGGVATVVAKLLLQALPDVALFGEKDYQQLLVIQRMVRDLDIPVAILGVPTVREPDGLAMSSRNAYLSPEERSRAATLYAVITAVAAEVGRGAAIGEAVERGKQRIADAGLRLDYLEVRRAGDLGAFAGRPDAPARVLVAAFNGSTRLIDNVAVPD